MNCEKCGEVCRCPMDPPPAASPGVEETPAWRDELSVRLNRYRARRKPLPPRYPSLRLPFDAVDPSIGTSAPSQLHVPVLDPASNHALALDSLPHDHSTVAQHEPESPVQSLRQPVRESVAHSAKIIEFPRFAWGPPPPPLDQLAEPVMDRPRILEVPEVAPPAPALGGITIEPIQCQEPERLPGVDFPLQRAPFARRFLAAMIDGVTIAVASSLFGYIFWKVAAVRPPQFQLIGLAAGIPCLLWAAYQYLLIVYAARTPGLFLARLELKRFDGKATTRALRRWRVFASWLSAASLGMGYAWLFLDEDALCWHDRITHTCFAPRPPATKH